MGRVLHERAGQCRRDPDAAMSRALSREIMRGLVAGLRETIRDERDYPTRKTLRARLTAARQTRRFDKDDPVMLSWLEPKLSDTAKTPEARRAKAHAAILKIPKGKSSKKHFPRPEGMSAATECAFIVSVLHNWDWPPTRTKDVQDWREHRRRDQRSRLRRSPAPQPYENHPSSGCQ
jgi:hypothetical protein